MIINKPSGLPVLAGGGFLKHTLIEFLNSKRYKDQNGLTAKPIHRLGRFTSGLLICARKKESRAQISYHFREHSKSSNECIINFCIH